MQHIYTRQAQAFLVPDAGLYNRPEAYQLVPFMGRLSGAIRSIPMAHKTPAIKMIVSHVNEAWANIHREMRPYFFSDLAKVIENYNPHNNCTVAVPSPAELDQIHPSMRFCVDVLVDLDRLTMLLQSDPEAVDVSERVHAGWSAMYRMTGRVAGLEKRIRNGKAFNGAV